MIRPTRKYFSDQLAKGIKPIYKTILKFSWVGSLVEASMASSVEKEN